MNSYVLLLMISAFLNTCPSLPSAAHYLIEVLRYYGNEFNSEEMSVIGGKIALVKFFSSIGLEVVDPFLYDTNAAASVTKFEEIRLLFRNNYEKLISLSKDFKITNNDNSILQKILQTMQ